MKAMTRFAQLLALLALTLSTPAWAQSTVEVIVPAAVVVTGERIWLGEIAQISGPDAQVADIEARLGHVSLGPAPRPGASRALTRGTIETRLRSALGTLEAFATVIPERVNVTRAATYIPPEQLTRALESWLQQNIGLQDAQVTVLYVGIKGPIPVPVGPYKIQFSVDSGQLAGATAVTVGVWQRGAEVARQRVSFKAEISAKVMVTTRDIAKGQNLSSTDIEMTTRRFDSLSGKPLVAISQAVGMETRRSLRAGTLLTDVHIVTPDDITQGDVVTVWIRSQGLTISAPGESRGNGHAGDTIPVFCDATGKVLKARIIGPGEVEVPYRAPAL